jgi:hypothetical protein
MRGPPIGVVGQAFTARAPTNCRHESDNRTNVGHDRVNPLAPTILIRWLTNVSRRREPRLLR